MTVRQRPHRLVYEGTVRLEERSDNSKTIEYVSVPFIQSNSSRGVAEETAHGFKYEPTQQSEKYASRAKSGRL